MFPIRDQATHPHRVLLIDDDLSNLTLTSSLLRQANNDVVTATTGIEGMSACVRFRPHVALIDLKLPDMSGIEVLRRLRETNAETAFVVVTGFGTCATAVEAMRLGAHDYLEKPVASAQLLEVVGSAIGSSGGSHRDAPKGAIETHSSSRVAEIIVKTVSHPSDPRTLTEWGQAVGASRGAIRNWCRTARVPARRALLFARVLRAVVQQRITRAYPEDLLNIVDRRTLAKVLIAAGRSRTQLPETVEDFLGAQALLGGPVVRRVGDLLKSRRSPSSERM